MSIVAFPMYVLPQVHADMVALWQAMRGLLPAGWPDAPRFDIPLDDGVPANLKLMQYCGYPYVTQWRGKLAPLASLHYDVPYCEGMHHCSVFVVPQNSADEALADLRGKVVAINGYDSNTGMNLLRHAVAPLAQDGRFFERVVETGAHIDSLRTVASGNADIASIDCVTFAFVGEHFPELVKSVRIIGTGARSPALPLFTRADMPAAERQEVLQAWRAVLADARYAALLKRLRIRGISPVSDADLQVIADYERQAIDAGYPVLA